MKKILFVAALILFAAQGFAQTQFGLYLSPNLSVSRIQADGAYENLSVKGAAPKIAFGPTVDYMFSENMSVNTGLVYAPKTVQIEGAFEGETLEERHTMQYLQVPVGFKLYTNELTLDTKMYFHLGGLAEVRISQKAEDPKVIDGFTFFDSSVMLGAGVERQVGPTNILFAGLSYKRGLVNVAKTSNLYDGTFDVKNDLIGLDLGIKF